MLPSGLPENVSDEEDLTRFLVHRSQFTEIMAKPAAFMPSPKDRETSVYRHGREPADELHALETVAAGSRTLYGAALVRAKVVREVGLDVAASEPPPRHAAIRGWPWRDEDPLDGKAEQKAIAAEIASAAGKPVIF
jgi:hypothetical protein